MSEYVYGLMIVVVLAAPYCLKLLIERTIAQTSTALPLIG